MKEHKEHEEQTRKLADQDPTPLKAFESPVDNYDSLFNQYPDYDLSFKINPSSPPKS